MKLMIDNEEKILDLVYYNVSEFLGDQLACFSFLMGSLETWVG